ncbi:MAG: response regulator [Pirellulales bacterium]
MIEPVGSLRIALADDDDDLRRVTVKLLERLGHRVVCVARNGAELLELCAQQEVEVVLVDLDMPRVDGLTAAEDLARRGIPVILISGHDDANRVVLEHEPIVACIRKPATLELLQRAIASATAHWPRE